MIIEKILVTDAAGVPLGEFNIFKDLKYGKRVNNYGSCSFAIPVKDPKAASLVALRQYKVQIYRNEVLVWAGEQVLRRTRLDAKGDNWATIQCYSWFEQLNGKYTDEEDVHTAKDQGEIAVDSIDGAFGITEGTVVPTMDRDRTYQNQNVMDLIIALGNAINGLEFEINDFKAFNADAWIGVDRSNSVILEYGFNVTHMDITEDFTKPINRAIVLGDSGDPLDPLRVVVNDTFLQGLYDIREGLSNEMMVTDQDTLTEKAEAMIQKFGLPLLKISMGIVRSTTPTIVDFALGDLIRLIVKDGFHDIDGIYRVFEWTVSYDADNTESLSLVLGNFTIPEMS